MVTHTEANNIPHISVLFPFPFHHCYIHRAESQSLRANIRAARRGGFRDEDQAVASRDALANTTDFSASVMAPIDPNLVQCPTCHRSFNQQAAERHIPRCKDIVAKPKRLVRGGGSTAAGRGQGG